MVKKILAVVVGLAVGVAVIWLIESIGNALFPPPDEFMDLVRKRMLEPDQFSDTDMEALQGFLNSLPLTAMGIVLLAHFIGTLVGSFTCATIVGRRWVPGAIIVGFLFLIAGLINLFMIPHPLWFGIVDVLIYVPAAFLGFSLAAKFFKDKQEKYLIA